MIKREESDRIRLNELNDAIKSLVNERTKFLDECMEKYSEFKIGDDVYDIDTGLKVGVVKRISRHHRGNAEYDTSFGCDIEFENIHVGAFYKINYKHGTKQDVIDRHQHILNKFKDL